MLYWYFYFYFHCFFKLLFHFITSYFYQKVQKYFCIINSVCLVQQGMFLCQTALKWVMITSNNSFCCASMRICNTSDSCWLIDWVKFTSQTLIFYLTRLPVCQKSWLLSACRPNVLTLCKSIFYFVTKKYFSQPVLLYFYLSTFNHQSFLLLLTVVTFEVSTCAFYSSIF